MTARGAAVRLRVRLDVLEWHLADARAGNRSLASSAFHATGLRVTAERLHFELGHRGPLRVVKP